MGDNEGILGLVLAGAADLFIRRHDTVLQTISKYFEQISKQFGLDPNSLLNKFSVELCSINAKEVRMTTKILLRDKYDRSYNIKPDISVVKLRDIPINIRNRVSSDSSFDATPEIRAKVLQGLQRWW